MTYACSKAAEAIPLAACSPLLTELLRDWVVQGPFVYDSAPALVLIRLFDDLLFLQGGPTPIQPSTERREEQQGTDTAAARQQHDPCCSARDTYESTAACMKAGNTMTADACP